MSLHRWSCLLFVVLACAAGCKKVLGQNRSQPTEEEKKRAALLAAEDEKRVASAETRLRFVETLAGKLPPVTPPSKSARVRLGDEWTRALWINEANLSDPTSEPKGLKLDLADATSKCALEARRPPFKTRQWSVLERCETARYLFVVRVVSRKEPFITEYASKDKQGEFSPGVAVGDVVVYDIAEKKHLGGFAWRAASSDTVQKLYLASDFEKNIASAIDSARIDAVTHP